MEYNGIVVKGTDRVNATAVVCSALTSCKHHKKHPIDKQNYTLLIQNLTTPQICLSTLKERMEDKGKEHEKKNISI